MPSSISGTRFVVVAACTACALLAALARAPDGAAAQAPNYLGCAIPKATIERATSRLRRTWISVYTKPSTSATTMSYTIASPFPLWITAESGAFYQVASGKLHGRVALQAQKHPRLGPKSRHPTPRNPQLHIDGHAHRLALRRALEVGCDAIKAGRVKPLTDDLLRDIAARGRKRAAARAGLSLEADDSSATTPLAGAPESVILFPVDAKHEDGDGHVFQGPFLDRALTVLVSHGPTLRDRGVLHAFVFGSVARREDGPQSDIDLVVDVRPGFGSFELMDVESFLSEALGRRVEIISRRGLLPDRHAEIMRDMVRAF